MKKFKNEIDEKFHSLVTFVESCDYPALLNHILMKYAFAPASLQQSLKRYFDKYSFWGKIDFQTKDLSFFKNKATDISSHIKEFKWLYGKLEDYSSKLLLYAILNNWLNFDTLTLKRTMENGRFKQYFHLDLIPSAKDEIFVDVGSYYGETSLDFINTYGENYKRIYCYEITPAPLEFSKQHLHKFSNIIFRQKAVKNKNGFVLLQENGASSSANQTSDLQKHCDEANQSEVESVTLDDDIKEKITMVKMDIEGDEISALKGAKNHIKKDCPKLLISVYHNNNHLWQIPKLIHSLNKNYKFFLRNFCGSFYPTEIVLFALPCN